MFFTWAHYNEAFRRLRSSFFLYVRFIQGYVGLITCICIEAVQLTKQRAFESPGPKVHYNLIIN